MVDETWDVAVVGAGLSGLAAARALEAGGRRVVVLEARERVGGRVVGHTWADGSVGELGAQWVGPTQTHMQAAIRDLGLELYPSYTAGVHQAHHRGRARPFRHGTYGLGPFALLDAFAAQQRLDRMARRVPLDAPWDAPKAAEWDGQTLESWLRRHMRTPVGRDFFRGVCTSVFCAEARDVSLLHFLFYVRSGGSIEGLLGFEGGAQEARVVGGSQRVPEALAERIAGPIRLATPVRAIEQHADGVVVRTDRGPVRAGHTVVTLPPPLAARLDYSPALPGVRDQLTQKVAMGSVIKCMARYPTPFWRAAGLSGFGVSVDAAVNIVLDNSPADGRCGVLVGFIEGSPARRMGQMQPAARRQAVLDAFARVVGPTALRPLEYVDRDWSAEPWTRGCYGAHFAPGVWTDYGAALRAPCGRIHWAGTETAAVWNGYMDGALRSGERAAGEILQRAPAVSRSRARRAG